MKYEEFEKRVVDTFNRMHYVESCDDNFIEAGSGSDVQSVLSESFKKAFHIDFTHTRGYYTSEEKLMTLDLDDMSEALNSYNDIMDKYHVVPLHSRPSSLKIFQEAMKIYAIMETDYNKRDYRVVYYREWDGDAESLREQLADWGCYDDASELSTLMIRLATQEEIEWSETDGYIE